MLHMPKTKMLDHIRLSSPESASLETGRAPGAVEKRSRTLILYILDDNSTQVIPSLLPDFRKRNGRNIHVNIEQFHDDNLYRKIIDTVADDWKARDSVPAGKITSTSR